MSEQGRVIGRRELLRGAGAISVGVVGGFSFSRKALAATELNVLAWCNHLDAKLLEPFEKATGAKVNVKEYEGIGTARGLLENSQPGDWDAFVLEPVDVLAAAGDGILAELDDGDYPWNDMFPELREPELYHKDGKLYAVPEQFGYNCIAYNSSKVDPADMRHMSTMWSGKYAGRIAVYDYYIPVIELVGLALGAKPAELNASNLAAIKEKLFEMKKSVSVIGDVSTVQNALVTGSADIIVGGSEFVVAGLQSERPELNWLLPDDGGLRWGLAVGVLEKSNKKDLAADFVKYMVGTTGQAMLSTSDCYWAMPVNSKADLNLQQKKALRWDEQPKFIPNSYTYYFGDPAMDKAMQEVWTEFLGK